MNRLALLIALLTPTAALGFSSGGHRIIAEIAWQQLDETTRAQAVELLKHHPRLEQDFTTKMPDSVRNGTQELKDHWLFLEASVWPDTTRGLSGDERAKYHRGTWHYINFPTNDDPRHRRRMTIQDDPRDDDPRHRLFGRCPGILHGIRKGGKV